MKYKGFYYTKRDFCGHPAGTRVRVHDWNDVEVQVVLRGALEWIPMEIFDRFFTDNPEEINIVE